MLDETKVKNIHLDSNTTPTVEAKLQADKKAPPMLDETKAKNIHIDSKNTPTVEAEPQTDKKLPVVACAMYTYHGNRHLITESYETWGKYCQGGFYPFSDETWQYKVIQ